MSGTLYITATPIGNMEDITYRAVRILKEVDLIAAEDTRNSRRILSRYDIHTPMTSYHEHNKIEKAYELVDMLKDGKDIALITDAGMPAISDPGEELVRIAADVGIDVCVVPGASASVSALAVSGLPARRFAFEAFLPKDKKKRRAILEELKNETRTIIMYEAPHHLKALLSELAPVLGNSRKISLCRELTKVHEEVERTSIGDAIASYGSEKEPRGEYVLVIEGKSADEIEAERQAAWEDISIEEHVRRYEDEGMDHKEAMKMAASDRGVPKREIYNALHKKKD